MTMQITARHFDLTPEMKTLAEENYDSLKRFFDNIISARLILDVERHRKIAELHVTVYNQTLKSTGQADDMYASIESVFDKAKGQLKKYKGKLKGKDPHKISSVEASATKPRTDDDAVDY
jgi:putative sigma-54 modulation protein